MAKTHNRRFYLSEKERFSLRKLSIGVVSVSLGLTFLSCTSQQVSASTESTSVSEEKSNNTVESGKVSNSAKNVKAVDHNEDVSHTEFTSNTVSQQVPAVSVKQAKVNPSKLKKKAESEMVESKVADPKKVDAAKGDTIKVNKVIINPQKKNKITNQVKVKQPERVSVHDPSIFKDPKTGKFYIFGSHQAEAESSDLYNWKPLFKKEYEQPSYIFNNYDKDLKKIFKWAGSHDGDNPNGYAIWAPDEIYNPDYKWHDGSKGAYMYYFSTSDSWIHSAIGFAVSKTVHGPYEFTNSIIYSGFTKNKEHNGDSSKKNDIYTNTNLKELIDSGKVNGFSDKWIRPDGTYNNDYAPNAIDVNIVTDKDNNLWMSYGSWSGGIYLLPLDHKTGMPIYPGKDSINKYGQKVDRYFGTHLIGGFHESGEAPYIKYDKNTGYYYLFTTYGGLTREGGYNMRIFRSKEINGKYTDALDQSPVYTKWKTNDSTKQENQKYGLKLEGNYDFSCLPYAYMSPGHNSVYVDDNDNWFLVNHTRFDHGTEYHEVRVKPMIMTENGWPIPLPFEYTGHEQKIDSSNLANIIKQISGKYEFVNNGRNTSGQPIPKANVILNDNHQVRGDLEGIWLTSVKGNHVYLTIKGKEGNIYTGEFKLQQDESKEHKPVLVFATEGNNEVLWGVKSYQEVSKNKNQQENNNHVDDLIFTNNSNFDSSSVTESNKIAQDTDRSDTVSLTVKSMKLMHAAYVYDINGNRIKSIPVIKEYKELAVLVPEIKINGRKFYRLANNKDHYIAVGNIIATNRKLHHNAYVYNKRGKRIKKNIVFKRGTIKKTYGSPVRIGKRLYYRVGVNKYIKAVNFAH